MGSEWREFCIGEIAEVIGGSTPSTTDPANFDGSIPWITPRDLANLQERYVSRGERNLSPKGLASCSAKLLPPGSVLLSSRAPIGYVAIAKNPLATNQGCRSLVLRDGFDSGFIYYWLKCNTSLLEQHANGTTFKEISGSSLRRIRLCIPPLSEQRAIASILGSLDDKIELNRQLSHTLEQMARALFKSWFVDFDPVRAKMEGRWKKGQSLPGLPAHLWNLFPDRLVPSELGEIPEGWEVARLGQIADTLRRAIHPDNIPQDTPYIGLEHMPRKSIALSDWGTAGQTDSSKLQFKAGEILFGKLRPYFHKVGIAPVNGICSTDIVVIAPKEQVWLSLVLLHLSSDPFISYCTSHSFGTKMPRTSWNDMARYRVVLPPQALAEILTSTVQRAVERLISTVHESRTLAAIRDALLPRLISGELRVKDAEEFIGKETSP